MSGKGKITGGTDKSLAPPTSRCILFDGENISFHASLVIYTINICRNKSYTPVFISHYSVFLELNEILKNLSYKEFSSNLTSDL